MKERDFIRAVAERENIPIHVALLIIKSAIEVIGNEVAKGGSVTVQGFGKFHTREFREQNFTNPHNGERYTAPKRVLPAFSPGEALKRMVREHGAGGNQGTEPEATA